MFCWFNCWPLAKLLQSISRRRPSALKGGKRGILCELIAVIKPSPCNSKLILSRWSEKHSWNGPFERPRRPVAPAFIMSSAEEQEIRSPRIWRRGKKFWIVLLAQLIILIRREREKKLLQVIDKKVAYKPSPANYHTQRDQKQDCPALRNLQLLIVPRTVNICNKISRSLAIQIRILSLAPVSREAETICTREKRLALVQQQSAKWSIVKQSIINIKPRDSFWKEPQSGRKGEESFIRRCKCCIYENAVTCCAGNGADGSGE